MKRPAIGDIIEIPIKHGLAYAWYVNYYSEPPVYGALIQVYNQVHLKRPSTTEGMHQGDSYYTFFPIAAGVRGGLVAMVGHESIPKEQRVRPVFRAYNVNGSGDITSRFIVDATGTHRVDHWTAEDRELSVKEIQSIESLTSRIERGWHPRQVA